MKKLFILFFILITFSLHSQDAELRLSYLFSKNDFFKLKDEYKQLKEKTSKPMQLFIESYLCSYFNQPEEANENIKSILAEYPDFLTAEHQLNMALLLSDNELKLQNYKNSASIYAQLIEQLTPYWDENSMKPYKSMYRLYNSLQNVKPMEISYLKYPHNTTISLKKDSVGLITLPVNSNNSVEKLDFILDFGAGFCVTEEKYADSLGIKILADSIMSTTAIGTTVYFKIGVADEILIGNIKIKNVIFLLSSNKILDNLPQSFASYEIYGIIGFPVLQILEKLTLTNSILTVSKSYNNSEYTSNMIICNNILFVQVVSQNDTLLMQFDSGTTNSYLTNRYLLKENAENLTMNSIKKGSVNGIKEFRVYKKQNFSCRIGTKDIVIPLIDIYIDDLQTTSLPIDGVIGQDIMRECKTITVDFKNMCINFD